MRPDRSKTRHRDEAVPWSIAATYRSLIATSSSPGDRAELSRDGPGRLAHVDEHLASRLTRREQSLRGTEDTHRAHAESTPVHDRGRQRHPGGGQLADLARLVLAQLRFAVERLVEATQDISVPQHPLDPLFA